MIKKRMMKRMTKIFCIRSVENLKMIIWMSLILLLE